MRHAILAALIWLRAATAPLGFEIESEKLFVATPSDVTLNVISTADTDLFTPLLEAFQTYNPTVSIRYVTASSTELMKAISNEGAAFDIAISSAMDLQTKLANDGLTQKHRSAATALLPDWGKWRDSVFSFTQEPAAIVISPPAFTGLPLPRTRQDLIALLRAHPDRFRRRVGTYDVRTSGLGYLFATQDARTSEVYWRLSEVMGALDARLYCCSSQMIEDVASGKIAVAYNVLGSYARARTDLSDKITIIDPKDFTTLMLRSVVIPGNAPHSATARRFVDHLIRAAWGDSGSEYYPFPEIQSGALTPDTRYKPIRLGPGLLVFLDKLKRQKFLGAWEDAVVQ